MLRAVGVSMSAKRQGEHTEAVTDERGELIPGMPMSAGTVQTDNRRRIGLAVFDVVELQPVDGHESVGAAHTTWLFVALCCTPWYLAAISCPRSAVAKIWSLRREAVEEGYL